MKILEEGTIPKFTLKCKHCGTKFEYQLSEIEYSGVYWGGKQNLSIKCPLCQIRLGWMEGEKVEEI